MPPELPTEDLSFKVVIESVTEEIYSNDTLLKFITGPVNPDFHFENNTYMTRIGSFGFLPTWGVSIPEGDYLKCYEDSSIYINYSGIPCDSVVTGIDENKTTARFLIYPNPTKGEIRISTENYSSFSIQIFDCLGKLVLEDIKDSGSEKTIDISSFTSGIYQIRIFDDRRLLTIQNILLE